MGDGRDAMDRASGGGMRVGLDGKEGSRPADLGAITGVSLSAQLERQLEELVAAGVFRVNDRLPSERELSDRFKVSRAVVRDALRALATRGLITIRQGVGATVVNDARRSLADMLATALRHNNYREDELLEARSALEVEVAGLAAQARTSQDLMQIKQALDEMRAAVAGARLQDSVDAHERFHSLLIRATNNRVLRDFIEPLTSQALLIAQVGMLPSWLEELDVPAHEHLYEFVAAQDREGAKAAMIVHARIVSLQVRVGRRRDTAEMNAARPDISESTVQGGRDD
jgi:GntR family transcriptional repressor for pyruvate dehydrogenase complex